ncbi:MAG TPA: hypothetical protein VL992_01395 [Tepidisphaeraceae bacterium]|nr:hypothetical protein [Tepidisphaeraceae bacterium]
MTQSNEMAQDLKFVRSVVENRDGPRPPIKAHLIIWALYSLICVPAYDFVAAKYALPINLAGLGAGFVLSWIFGRRAGIRSGQHDHEEVKKTLLHWYVGIALVFVACFGLSAVNPKIDGIVVEQVSIILVGFLYFTAGVHEPDSRFMRIAGPVIIVCGVLIRLVPHFRSTAMGLIFAACLLAPLIFSRKNAQTN